MPTAGDVGVDKYLVIEILAADHKYLLWLNLRFIKLLIHFTKLCPERFGSAPPSASQRGVVYEGFPAGASGKEPTNAGDTRDLGSIPGSGSSPGEGHGNPLQYSCLEDPMDKEA